MMLNFQAENLKLVKPSPAMAVSVLAKDMRSKGRDVIDLSIGEPDFDTPAHIIDAAIAAMKAGATRYTAADGTPELKDAIVEKFRRENGLDYVRAEISAANGAKQIIFNALMATLNAGEEVLVPAPYWVSYTDMVLLIGGKPKVYACPQQAGFKLTPERLEEMLTPQTRWLMLNSPSNPSGATYSRAELVALGAVIERYPNLLIMSDEIYEQIYYADEPFSSFVVACPQLRDRTLIVNGVSKTYAMTGWRLGYAAGPKDLISVMAKVQSQSTSNPSSVSQAAAIAALNGPQDFVAQAVAEYRARRDLVVDGLSRIDGLSVRSPDGAFYAFPSAAGLIGRRTPNGEVISDDTKLVSYLLSEGEIACVQGAAFGLEPYFRVSFATSREKLVLSLERLSRAVSLLD
jgi:aspartate aminotransferase